LQAKKLGLLNIKDTPTAIKQYSLDKNIALFEKHRIFTKQEILARQTVLFEEYIKQIRIEALTMVSIFVQQILPAVSKYESYLANLIQQKQQIKVEYKLHLDLLKQINELLIKATNTSNKISKDLENISGKYLSEKAFNYHKYIFKSMKELRTICDELECICPKTVWPFPTYSDILFF
jgi:glutamine synthetase